MSKFALTDEQQLAVNYRGGPVLVSAAAGSGKTRVLTERLMGYITDSENPQDIDKFLIITYTRAAAAELRGRILEELSARSAEMPQNRRLRRQTSLCYNASIGTIHSFCTAVIRENCHELGLGPDFRVGDEDRCSQLKSRALDRVLDEAYENIDSIPGFAALASTIGAGNDDSRLAKTILQLHEQLESHPYPDGWAQEQIERLESGDCSEWSREILSQAEQTVEYWHGRLAGIWEEICSNQEDNAPLIAAYGSSVEHTLGQLNKLLIATRFGWEQARSALPVEYPRLGGLRNFPFEETKDRFISARTGCKAATEKLSTVFSAPIQVLENHVRETTPALTALIRLALEFDKIYSAEKRRQNLLDFSDLEHFAVQLLCNRETGAPTQMALRISRRFTEIMVDEYQDVSAVQEYILQSVSQNGKNLFMVGDVKQSIYRFRLADPSIFLRKYESYAAPDEKSDCGTRILLRRNFRSDAAVLDACNCVFWHIMSEKLGEIDYDENCALKLPDDAPEKQGKVILTVLGVENADDSDDRPDKTSVEASFVAGQIKRLVESGEVILDGGRLRPIEYGDIAILLRSPGSSGGIYARALKSLAVPVSSDRGGGFFESPEIVTMTAFLEVVDNPHRDIPLAAALASPMFGFSADELAKIRTAQRGCDFYTALKVCADTDDKCRSFLQLLENARALAPDLSVRRLINRIYDELGLFALWTAVGRSPDGAKNLMLLSDMAQQYEAGGYRGLRGFLDSLGSMRERGQEPDRPDSSTGCVTIMSIHKSKGLEFPVVFLADTSRKFNLTHLSQPVLIHPTLGIGGKITQPDRGIEFPSLAHKAIKSRLTTEALSEEMRVLYVAMTRAKQRLYISCTCADPGKLLSDIKAEISKPLAPALARTCTNPAKWLIMAALADDSGSIELRSAAYTEAPALPEQPADAVSCEVDAARLEKLRRELSFLYPHEGVQNLPSKLTATMLPDEEHDEKAAELVPSRPRIFSKPDLSGDSRPLTAAERGTATHLVMQFIDFKKVKTGAEIRGEIDRIASLGLLSPAQAQAVDASAIERFFASDVGCRIAGADSVRREFRFSVFCPAEKFFPGAGDEKLLLQGIVDCCIEESGKLTIIDYKTDYVTPQTVQAVAEHYKPQLSAYAWAMERITKKPVDGCILCFVSAGLFVEF